MWTSNGNKTARRIQMDSAHRERYNNIINDNNRTDEEEKQQNNDFDDKQRKIYNPCLCPCQRFQPTAHCLLCIEEILHERE